MKKALLIVLFLLMVSVSLVTADTVDDLARLARYFPAETPLYIAFYISDEAIENWDAALRQVLINLDLDSNNPNDPYDRAPLRSFLDDVVQDVDPSGTFDSVYRPWLGDTMAIGALTTETLAFGSRSSTGESSILLIADITDHDLAEEHMDNVIRSGAGLFEQFEDYEKTVEDDYILYHPSTPQRSEITFMLIEDALLIRFSSIEVESLLPEFEQSLAEVEAFEESLRRLPLDYYEIIGYFDPSALAPYAEDYDAEIRINTILPQDANSSEALKALGAQSFGFAFVDTLSLTLDWATHVDDPEALEEAGIKIVSSPSVDLEITRSLPRSVNAFIQDTGFGFGILQILTYFKATGVWYSEYYEDYDAEYDYDHYIRNLSYYDEMAISMIVSYLGLKEQIPEALQGEHILYSTRTAFVRDPRTIGLLLEVPDSGEALSILPTIFELQDIEFDEEDEALILTGIAEVAEDDSFLIQIKDNAGFLQIGFEGSSVDFEGELIGGDAAYLRAEQSFVPDAQIIAYINVGYVLESCSISGTWDEEGTGYIRVMARLAEN